MWDYDFCGNIFLKKCDVEEMQPHQKELSADRHKQIGGDHYAGHNNGGNTDYYKLPEGATELQDIIEHKKMHWNIANMFKALYRMGQQDHSSIERDLNKIEYFLKRHKELLRKDMR